MNPQKIRRFFIKFILVISLLIAIVLTILSYIGREWATAASSMSVITAVLAIWISLNLTWRQEDEKQAHIILYIDKESHKYAFSLVIKNVGGSPAYNLRLNWTKPVYDFENKIPRFTDFQDEYDFLCIPNGMQFSRFLFGADTFKKLCHETHGPLIFEVEVSYSYTTKYKFCEKHNFKISLEPFKKRLNVLNDQMDFYSENIKLTANLNSIAKSLQNLNKRDS